MREAVRSPIGTGEPAITEQMKAVVGGRIRKVRQRLGMSLSELARLSQIAKATLSNIEAGEANPTLETLDQLSSALKTPLGELLAEPRPAVSVFRASEGREFREGPVSITLVSDFDIGNSRLELYYGGIDANASHQSPGHGAGVIEHIILHSGRLEAGPVDDPVILEPGDYMRFDASKPHIYRTFAGEMFITMLMEYHQR